MEFMNYSTKAKDTNDWQENTISTEQIIELLDMKIKSVSFSSIKEDVVRFIKNDDVLSIWSPEYFKNLIEKIKFKNS
jgi:hypothetical protein